jgi:hypothetical protein
MPGVYDQPQIGEGIFFDGRNAILEKKKLRRKKMDNPKKKGVQLLFSDNVKKRQTPVRQKSESISSWSLRASSTDLDGSDLNLMVHKTNGGQGVKSQNFFVMNDSSLVNTMGQVYNVKTAKLKAFNFFDWE